MAGHKSQVIWSPDALDDIDRLWTYYAGTAGRFTADKLLREVAAAVEMDSTLLSKIEREDRLPTKDLVERAGTSRSH